ncbi:V-type proton ATPase subunit E-like isoform X2 [Artemia franciscana]|uniref:V-type proton ATPase subunit E-like isoform X2 n=1 Tax=Artemia franciscana TaxID=6661 RepID=UPI0032DB429D
MDLPGQSELPQMMSLTARCSMVFFSDSILFFPSSSSFILDSSSVGTVSFQIKQMMGFIEQEANEKVEEIDAKAEEEFNIEKGRLVQQHRLKIMETYDRKEKAVELQKKIQSSTMLNQARLRVLKAQDDHVGNVIEETKKRLSDITRDQAKYLEVLKSLIVQGLFQLMEATVALRCREVDVSLVQRAVPDAIKVYKQATSKEAVIKIDTECFLPTGTFGGVELSAMRGRIRVVNTLETRLDMIAQQLLPDIRNTLFGRNPNRRFLD